MAIIRHVIDDIIGTIFTSSADDTNVSPQRSFPGAQSPGATTTTVTLKPGISSIALLLQQANATAATAAYHNKCSGGDIITRTHNETIHPTKDTTTPFVLPIPFP